MKILAGGGGEGGEEIVLGDIPGSPLYKTLIGMLAPTHLANWASSALLYMWSLLVKPFCNKAMIDICCAGQLGS